MSDLHASLSPSLPPGDWLVEPVGDSALFGLRAGKLVASGRSEHQVWDVWDTPALGRLYRLDGRIMAAEYDEFVCHETLVHMAGLAHPGLRSALILGGGDGGSARELLRYPSMQRVVVAELDEAVVALSRQHLSAIHAGAFDDARVQIVFGDAACYVRETAPNETFDMIVFDLTDPDGGAGGFFTTEFFSACVKRLSPLGAICLHLGSPLSQCDQIWGLRSTLRNIFPAVTLFFPTIPSYGGAWAMACASFALQPASLSESLIAQRIAKLAGSPLRGLNPLAYRYLLEPPAWAAL